MVYVVDTCSFNVFSNYYPDRFPTFWERLAELIGEDRIISVGEVYTELGFLADGHLLEWVEANKGIFLPATQEETIVVNEIFQVPHFRQLVSAKAIAEGRPVADPFLIAAAKAREACVVTEERFKENAAKIPNVCDHFGVKHTNVDGFLGLEGWVF